MTTGTSDTTSAGRGAGLPTDLPAPLLAARGIRKSYGAVHALSGIDFSIVEGELVGLVGDNGAGKSTLVKTLSGAVEATGGTIEIGGHPATLRTPNDARAVGIETVYQDLGLCENLTVAENVFLGREPRRGWGPFRRIDHRRMVHEVSHALATLSINVPHPEAMVGELSGGQRQAVALSRCRLWHQKIVILDEPTAALGVQESERVVQTINELKGEGIAIILISHDIPMIMKLADRIVVLRKGRVAADVRTADVTEHDVVALITGADAGKETT